MRWEWDASFSLRVRRERFLLRGLENATWQFGRTWERHVASREEKSNHHILYNTMMLLVCVCVIFFFFLVSHSLMFIL